MYNSLKLNQAVQNHSAVLPFNQSQTVIEIERLVNDIKTSFHPIQISPLRSAKDARFDHHLLVEVMQSLPRFLSVYQADYQYSPHLDVFWRACWDMGLLSQQSMFILSRYAFQLVSMDQVLRLFARIAQDTRCSQFNELVNRRRYQVTENRNSLTSFARALHHDYARLLVVRVDLGYCEEFRHLVKIEDVFQHRKSFFRMKEYHPAFEYWVAQAWAVEQGGKTGGYHIHAVFYFRGDKRQQDWAIGRELGELWCRVTPYGRYHNCNTPEYKAIFERHGTLGIGMIYRDDPVQVQNAINAVKYLSDPTKEKQHLRIKPAGARTIGFGRKAARKTAKRHAGGIRHV